MALLQLKDVGRHREWDSDEVVNWLCCGGDGEFEKYKDGLRTAFHEEGVNGSHLVHIGKSELRKWGIKSFGDRVAMDQRIRRLVSVFG